MQRYIDFQSRCEPRGFGLPKMALDLGPSRLVAGRKIILVRRVAYIVPATQKQDVKIALTYVNISSFRFLLKWSIHVLVKLLTVICCEVVV